MDLGLKGKVAIVAGSSKGLGKAVALELAQEGANVVICSRNESVLLETAREIGSRTGVQVLALPVDVSKAADVENLINTTGNRFGRIDILVNNAGGPPTGSFENMPDEEWAKAIEQNLLSAVRMSKAVVPFMKKQGWGRIINITSLYAKEPMEGFLLSNSARAGVIGLAKTMSMELGKYNITVNSVLPGLHETARLHNIFQTRADQSKKSYEEVRDEEAKGIPLRRIGDPKELAAAVAFLASERAGYITGVALVVDGGVSRSAF
ncbi:MAG TPA: SDR family oxidoreductase [Chloroflexia bacterium]|nr:SDR family oxidoreductase [Chloroflexia bacterium]